MGPHLLEAALDPLRDLAAASLLDEAVVQVATEVRSAGAQYLTGWVPEGWDQARAVPARYVPARAGGTNFRADKPTPAGSVVVFLPAGTAVESRNRLLVRGYVDEDPEAGVAWARTLVVAKVDAPRPHELRRRVYCEEVT